MSEVSYEEFLSETKGLKPLSEHKEPGWWTADYLIDNRPIRFAGLTMSNKIIERTDLFDEEFADE